MQPAIHRPVRLLTPRKLWLLTFVIGILFAIKLVDVIVSGLAGTTDLEAYTAAAANLRAGAPIYWLPIVHCSLCPPHRSSFIYRGRERAKSHSGCQHSARLCYSGYR